MFKVLKDVLEEKGDRTEVRTSARVGGRVRSKAAKEHVAKQLQKGLEGVQGPTLDLKTGELKTKKKKVTKEKTPEEQALKDAKGYLSKFHGSHLYHFCYNMFFFF